MNRKEDELCYVLWFAWFLLQDWQTYRLSKTQRITRGVGGESQTKDQISVGALPELDLISKLIKYFAD